MKRHRRRIAVKFFLSTAALVGAMAMSSCSRSSPEPAAATNAPPVVGTSTVAAAAPVANTTPENLLNGRWLRPDGGYVIEVRAAQSGGTLEAYYFNPRPINVAKAEWRRESDGLHVFVELRDQNYPGATYKLRYLPEQDQLTGEYYQPLVAQTFAVNFVRQPK